MPWSLSSCRICSNLTSRETTTAGRGRSLQDAKEKEIVQGNRRRLKAPFVCGQETDTLKGVSFLFDTAKPLWYFSLLGTNLHGTQRNKPICLKPIFDSLKT